MYNLVQMWLFYKHGPSRVCRSVKIFPKILECCYATKIMWHISCVTYHVSLVTFHLSPVTVHQSYVTVHLTTTLWSFSCFECSRRLGDTCVRGLVLYVCMEVFICVFWSQSFEHNFFYWIPCLKDCSINLFLQFSQTY